MAPGLAHVWMQLGHAERALGQHDPAALAYHEAAALWPAEYEPPMEEARALLSGGRALDAARCAAVALRIAPTSLDTQNAFHAAMRAVPDGQFVHLPAVLRAAAPLADGPDPALFTTLADACQSDGLLHPTFADGRSLFLDVTDLLAYFRHARRPTGIQRVQLELADSAIAAADGEVGFLYFVEGRDDWIEIPPAWLGAALRGSADTAAASADWGATLLELNLRIDLLAPAELPRSSTIVNVGTSWWLKNYFLRVRDLKRRFSIRYVPFVHDLIPVVTPEYCIPQLRADFMAWLAGVFDHADYFVAVSQHSKCDLLRVAEKAGHALRDDDVDVLPLDARFSMPATSDQPWPLGSELYILFVGTIEARKGHLIALEAFARLVERHGSEIPRLVLVGSNGLGSEAALAFIAAHPALGDRVTILRGVSDGLLTHLYRRCLFTLYPSFYEGWGLPVTEALVHGKIPVIAQTSSLPEAGGPFAVYVPAGSAEALETTIARLIDEPEERARLERKIAEDFRPRTWDALRVQLKQIVASVKPRDPAPSTIAIDRWYSLAGDAADAVSVRPYSGEIYRAGRGWRTPTAAGNAVSANDARLVFEVSALGEEQLTLNLLVRNMSTRPIGWQLAEQSTGERGRLEPGASGWACLPISNERTVVAIDHGSEDGAHPLPESLVIVGLWVSSADPTRRANALLALSHDNPELALP